MAWARCAVWIGWLGAIALAGTARAAEGEDVAALETLQKKGLRKLSSYFALTAETDVAKAIRAADSMRKKVADAQREVNALEKKIEEKRKTIVAYLQKRRELRAQLAMTNSVTAHNNIVNALNELADRINLLQQSNEDEEALKKARAAANSVAEAYVERLLTTRKLYEDVQDHYEELAGDKEVAKALEAYNKTSPKAYQLGPGPTFLGYGRKLKSLEELVLSEEIDIRRGGGNLWYVSVVFNGKHVQEMAIDTGASIIALPAAAARNAGLSPSADDATVQLQMADGSVVEAKMVNAASVRVGKFTVENVECAVMPEHLAQAAPLLGQSFFKHFSFKIDAEKSKLVMSKIEVPETGRGPGGR